MTKKADTSNLSPTLPITLNLPRGLFERTAQEATKQGLSHEQILIRMIADEEARDLVNEWRERNGNL